RHASRRGGAAPPAQALLPIDTAMISRRSIGRVRIAIVMSIVMVFGSFVRSYAAPFPGTLDWELRANFPTGVHSAAGGVMDGTLYVSHGLRGSNSAALSMYDPLLDVWSAGPNASLARTGVGGAVLDGRFYALGGTP